MENTDEKEFGQNIFSVTDLNLYVKSLLIRDENLQDLWVRGEISNFSHHNKEHMYFSLKDDNSEIKCVMFHGDNKDLEFEPEEGMDVLCRGSVSLYTPRGSYQVIIKEMVLGGIGKLYLAYEKLKSRLEEEGLFSDEYKKDIPFLPTRVGIVTSQEGAALRDIVSVLKRRYENIDILLSPTPVQGKDAASQIADAIELIDNKVDLIIVSRGGGSIEDLWCFNEEEVARAVFDAEIPIISAVGHETDFLISDFVADHRSPTPSAAAEKAVPEKEELKRGMAKEKVRLNTALSNMITEFRRKLEELSSSPIYLRPEMLIEEHIQRMDDLHNELVRNLKINIDTLQNRFTVQKERLKALGPFETMDRGFAIVQDESGVFVKKIEDIAMGDRVTIKFCDGDAKAEIKEVKKCQKKK
ncbi:MAG: exodeoxyribonuclease VII large subunit [Thermoplasmata archaeon]